MRERTSWNRDQIKQASMPRQADPYAMNQDHLSQQPKADKYLTGDPSTFAEDVTEPNTWDAEYANGQTKRNEIGQPEFRSETFTHGEKTAKLDEATLLKKADLCTRVAKLMLRGRKFASVTAFETAVEDQSVALMHIPSTDLIATADRLATDEQFPGGEFPHQSAEQQQQQQQQQAGQQQEQQQAGMQQQSAVYQQAAQKCMQAMQQGDAKGMQAAIQEMANETIQQQNQAKLATQRAAKRAADEAQQGQQQTQQAGMSQQAVEAMIQNAVQQAVQQQQGQGQAGPGQQQAADYDSHKGPAVNPPGYGAGKSAKRADDQQQGQQGQQMQQQAAPQQQDQGQQQMQQQAAPQQQQQDPAQGQQMQQQADDALLDDMLMGPGGECPTSEMDIEMETPSMDVGEVVLAHEDEVLKTLFANEETEQAQQAQAQQGEKTAGMARTASTRTLGTRPTGGVSKVGGAPSGRSGGDVDKLAALWPSAPDVRDAFNMK